MMINNRNNKDNKENRDFEDDNRTIADMSWFDKTKEPLFEKNDDPNKEPLRGRNLWAFIMGTMKATILIWLAYVVVFGVVILLMYLYFKSKL